MRGVLRALRRWLRGPDARALAHEGIAQIAAEFFWKTVHKGWSLGRKDADDEQPQETRTEGSFWTRITSRRPSEETQEEARERVYRTTLELSQFAQERWQKWFAWADNRGMEDWMVAQLGKIERGHLSRDMERLASMSRERMMLMLGILHTNPGPQTWRRFSTWFEEQGAWLRGLAVVAIVLLLLGLTLAAVLRELLLISGLALLLALGFVWYLHWNWAALFALTIPWTEVLAGVVAILLGLGVVALAKRRAQDRGGRYVLYGIGGLYMILGVVWIVWAVIAFIILNWIIIAVPLTVLVLSLVVLFLLGSASLTRSEREAEGRAEMREREEAARELAREQRETVQAGVGAGSVATRAVEPQPAVQHLPPVNTKPLAWVLVLIILVVAAIFVSDHFGLLYQGPNIESTQQHRVVVRNASASTAPTVVRSHLPSGVVRRDPGNAAIEWNTAACIGNIDGHGCSREGKWAALRTYAPGMASCTTRTAVFVEPNGHVSAVWTVSSSGSQGCDMAQEYWMSRTVWQSSGYGRWIGYGTTINL